MRIAIVNDTKMSLEILSRVVAMDPDCKLIWTAENGAEAVDKCMADTPDLLIMDIFMPVMNGTEATRRIMAIAPCPILIVTASVSTQSTKVFETLGAGALDAIRTPSVGPDGQLEGLHPLLRKIYQFKQLSNSAHCRSPRVKSVDNERATKDSSSSTLVVIGASTGGPNALAEMLSQIPASINASFIVIQHVDRQFAQGLASWLDSLCELSVRIAKPGDRPHRGVALIAATNDHMVMNCNDVLQYTVEPEDNPFRPSADVFFASVACKCREKGLAVLLTGIGRDGASGLLALKNAGWHTFAQSKETCVVYGMPKAAIELGAACDILSPKDIGRHIVSLVPSVKGA